MHCSLDSVLVLNAMCITLLKCPVALSAVKQCLGLFVLSTQAGKLLDSSWCFAQPVIFADAWLLLWLSACMLAGRQLSGHVGLPFRTLTS